MKVIEIPNYGMITIKNVIFDVNGTIQFNGIISEQISDKITQLKEFYKIYLVSSDTRGNLKNLAKRLGVGHIRIKKGEKSEVEAKNKELLRLGKNFTVAIGNGNNDYLMLKNAVLGICVICSEGASVKAIMNSDIVVSDPISAINCLLDEKILIATLRA